MPKTPIDYSKTSFYKIVCNDLTITDVYVGHTTDFTKRKSSHKFSCNNPEKKEYDYKLYTFIRENGGWDNFSMIQIEEKSVENSKEATKYERELYELLNAKLNTIKPFITTEERKEYNKEYLKNRNQSDEFKQSQKQYDKIRRQTDKHKQYRQTDEYKQYHKQYQQTDKYKEYQKEYQKQRYLKKKAEALLTTNSDL